MNIIEACNDNRLFRPWFNDMATWQAQFAILKAIFGLTMDRKEKRLLQVLTKRDTLSQRQVSEAWIIAGRRSAKTFLSALVLTYIAAFREHSLHLQPGEQAACILLAVDRSQSSVAFRYVLALFKIPLPLK